MTNDIDVLLGLGPWRFDAQENVQRAEDVAGLVVNLAIKAEQSEGISVVVVVVFIGVERAIVARVEDDGIDLVADFGR